MDFETKRELILDKWNVKYDPCRGCPACEHTCDGCAVHAYLREIKRVRPKYVDELYDLDVNAPSFLEHEFPGKDFKLNKDALYGYCCDIMNIDYLERLIKKLHDAKYVYASWLDIDGPQKSYGYIILDKKGKKYFDWINKE